MRRLVLGTAGHIDHGKTALVRALTGVDTDRLPEEKRRGITIDLGFAALDLDDGTRFSIVDVPGHEAFIRNMVAGASGIDMVMLVVAADEGVMPQTREHLAIVQLLGIARGVVVLTKRDLADDDWLALVRADIDDLVATSPLADAPVIAVSARSGEGLDELRAALQRLAAESTDNRGDDLFRMPIDRVFTVRGTGTVVTGTVWSGSLRRDGQVRALPAGATARVRGVQQHGTEADQATAGSRAAIALGGVDREALSRGDTLVAGPAWDAGGILTIALDVLPDASASIRPRQRVRVHAGTAEVLGRVAMLQAEVEPGAHALAQLRLETPVIVRAGDRLVIRSYSPVHTIAGGLVIEPAAPRRRRASPEAAGVLDRLRTAIETRDSAGALAATVELAGSDGAECRTLPMTTGMPPRAVEAALNDLCGSGVLAIVGDRVVRGARVADLMDRVLGRVSAFHDARPMLDGMPREILARDVPHSEAWLFEPVLESLLRNGLLVATGNALALPGHAPRLDEHALRRLHQLADLFDQAALQPPELDGLPADPGGLDPGLLLTLLERDGRLVRLGPTRWMSARAISEGVAALRSQLPVGQPLGVAEFKQVLNLTRKHLIPFLEYLDRTGITRRDGDARTLTADPAAVPNPMPGPGA
jgi:selenocysteine-specific elongation factor